MKIFDAITPITKAAEDAKLTDIDNRIERIYEQFINSFRTAKTLVDLELEYHIKSTEIQANRMINDVNKMYRTDILNVSADYKREGMTVWSFNAKTLTDLIATQFSFTFNQKSYKDRVKLDYTSDKLINAVITALALLFSKYQTVYQFQIQATFVKVIIDFFNYGTIRYKYLEIPNIYSQIINMDMNVLAARAKELNIQPKVRIQKTQRKPKIKTELPAKEQFEYWLRSGQYTVTQLKDIIAKQFKVSAKTVQRKLAEYGLTRQYQRN